MPRDRDYYLDDAALADYLGVSPRTPAGWRLRGEGPAWTKVGPLVRYRKSDVDAWLEANRHQPSPA